LPRHDNYVWEQLADDRLWASIICDGTHLPATMVRSFLRVKTPARTILTCDASPLAGLLAGVHRMWDQEFEVLPEGKIVVRGTEFLGGSWAFTDRCIANAVRQGGVSLREAIDMAGLRPWQLFGKPVPVLQPGQRTALVLFDWEDQAGVSVKFVAL
jgi:N-acetylglucosamine-6-phosphate deacetylase